jgi:hypothetical protein
MEHDEKILLRAINNNAFNNYGSSRPSSPKVDGQQTQVQLFREIFDDFLRGLQPGSLRAMVPYDGGGEEPESPVFHLVASKGV